MIIIGGVNMGELPKYLFHFADGSEAADWMDAKHGYLGDVAVNGIIADQHTNSGIPYAGTISTNNNTLGEWQGIVDANPTQAFAALNKTALIDDLTDALVSAFQQINVLPASTGFESRSAASLDGLNTQNGVSEVYVINITSGFDVADPINITGDAGDVFILRWDEDADPSNGYQGRVRFRQGGGIVPHGGLTAANFINVAGQIDSAGGGSPPASPYPQGPRYDDGSGNLIVGGSDWTGGGFFTGYWLTTGEPTTLDADTGLYYGITASLPNATFVGGWYTLTTRFVLNAQSGGVHVSPNPGSYYEPKISLTKLISPDDGVTWLHVETPPGPDILPSVMPRFRFVAENTGNAELSNIAVNDSVCGFIGSLTTLPVGESFTWERQYPWSYGEHENGATATAEFEEFSVSAEDSAYYNGVSFDEAAIALAKYVSVDGGETFLRAPAAPGPLLAEGINVQFKYVVTNTGNVALSGIVLTDDVIGEIATLESLDVGEEQTWIVEQF